MATSGLDRVRDAGRRALAAVRSWTPAAIAIDALARFFKLQGTYVAAAVSLNTILAIFPLLLVIVAVVGWFSVERAADVTDSIVENLGLTSELAATVESGIEAAQRNRVTASLVGFLGFAWTATRLARSLQYAVDRVWGVPYAGLRASVVGVVWLLGTVVFVLAAVVLGTLVSQFEPPGVPLGLVVAFALSVLAWLLTGKVLGNRDVDLRDLLPGSVLGALGLSILREFGELILPLFTRSSVVLGSIGISFVLVAWALLFGYLFVVTACVNATVYEHRHGHGPPVRVER